MSKRVAPRAIRLTLKNRVFNVKTVKRGVIRKIMRPYSLIVQSLVIILLWSDATPLSTTFVFFLLLFALLLFLPLHFLCFCLHQSSIDLIHKFHLSYKNNIDVLGGKKRKN